MPDNCRFMHARLTFSKQNLMRLVDLFERSIASCGNSAILDDRVECNVLAR